MAKVEAFEKHADEYDQWYDDHPFAYESELAAVKSLLPKAGLGLEIGVGTGRFSSRLGIQRGVEPSLAMREIAKTRHVDVLNGVAEQLPFAGNEFDYVLFATTICFLDSVEMAVRETFRVLKPGGVVVIGLIDRNSARGREYENKRNDSRFYKEAVFRSVEEVATCLEHVGFGEFQYAQTLFRPLIDIASIEPVMEGYGKGAFVVVKAVKFVEARP